jgi:hypothetical protein
MAATMKRVRLFVGLLAMGLAAGCLENASRSPGTSATVLYRHHFLGTTLLAHNTNSARLAAVLALPSTGELRDEVLQKLAKAPHRLWQKFLPAGAAAPSELVRPLLDDLVSAESYAEVRGPAGRSDSILAIELNDERAALWRTNLWSLLAAWKLGQPKPITLGESKGWELKRGEAPASVQFVRAGTWVLIGVGQERLTQLPAFLEQISKSGRPAALQPAVLLDLEADLPRLGDWLPAVAKVKLPPTQLTITGRGDHLRSEARLAFSEALPWKYEPWKFPTNAISDPIVMFTVARGIAPLLSQVKGLAELGLKPLPNQFCAWGPPTVLASTFATFPASDPANVLYEIGPKLPDFFHGLLSEAGGGFALISNRNELVWGGWPVVQPFLHPFTEAGTDYLLAGLFPLRRTTNPVPPEVFAQLKGRTNLVYYDWEYTQQRLLHAKQLLQIYDMMGRRRFAPTNSPPQKWLFAVASHLGNTVTEASLTSPKELSVVRRSDVGFTGFELATFARWVASPGFPWTFEPGPLISSRTNAPGARTNPSPPKAIVQPPKARVNSPKKQ